MRSKSNKRHPYHGSNTLIQEIPETLCIGNQKRWHGCYCMECLDFEHCLRVKGGIAYSRYCHWPTKKFRMNWDKFMKEVENEKA